MTTYTCTVWTKNGVLLKGHGTETRTGDQLKAPHGLLMLAEPSWGTKDVWVDENGGEVKDPRH